MRFSSLVECSDTYTRSEVFPDNPDVPARPPRMVLPLQLESQPSRPFAGGSHVTNGLFGDPLLLLVSIENGGAVTCTDVVALTIQRGWIMNLKEKLEQLPIA